MSIIIIADIPKCWFDYVFDGYGDQHEQKTACFYLAVRPIATLAIFIERKNAEDLPVTLRVAQRSIP